MVLAVAMAGQSPRPGESGGEGPERVGRLDQGAGRVEPPRDLSTPQASLENFIDSSDRGDHARAARSLDLRSIPVDRRREEVPSLARRLKAVMDAQVWFRWDEVPDRPDGQDDGEASGDATPPGSPGASEKPGPRSNVRLYTLDVGDRDYEIRLERV